MSGRAGRDCEIVILAAGASQRFGGIKALAAFRGRSLLQRAVDEYRGMPGCTLTVVLGANQREIESRCELATVKVVVNPEWREGMASSVRAAVAAAEPDSGALLFVAVDQPLLTGDHLMSLRVAAGHNPEKMIAARYAAGACAPGAPKGWRIGIPALFPQVWWPQLSALEGDRGARSLLRRAADVVTITIQEAAWDVDTRDDLQRLEKQTFL